MQCLRAISVVLGVVLQGVVAAAPDTPTRTAPSREMETLSPVVVSATRGDPRSVVPVYAILWLVVTSLLLLFPVFLFAHAKLIRADPAVDTHVSQLPREIRLWFSESIEHRFSRITVHRATRAPATGALQPQERVDAGLALGPRVTRELAVKLPETLPPGLYLVQWQVLSIDSHRTTGSFTLTYDPRASAAPEADKAKPTP